MRKEARELRIRGYSIMKKEALLKAIRERNTKVHRRLLNFVQSVWKYVKKGSRCVLQAIARRSKTEKDR